MWRHRNHEYCACDAERVEVERPHRFRPPAGGEVYVHGFDIYAPSAELPDEEQSLPMDEATARLIAIEHARIRGLSDDELIQGVRRLEQLGYLTIKSETDEARPS